MSTALIPGWYIEFQTALLRQAPRPDEIDQVTAEGWTKNQAGLKRVLCANLLPPKTPSPVNPFLRRLSTDQDLILDPTDGKGMIGKATDVFTGWIDGDFENYGCNVTSHATTERRVTLYEMAQDATFAQIFTSLNADLDKLCLTQDQIIQFCVKYRHQLHPKEYATLLLFKVNGKFFVASVDWDDADRLSVFVSRFSFDDVWGAEDRYRVVVPQLTPVASGS